MPPVPKLFAVGVVVLAVGGALAASRSSHRRYESARERALAECRAFRASPGRANADVCRTDPFARPLELLKRGRAAVVQARSAARRRDVVAFGTALAEALERANELDDRGSTIGALAAARIVDEVLDVLELNRSMVDDASRAALLARAHLRAADHPFEAERVHTQWMLSEEVAEARLPPVFVVSEGRAAEQMLQADVALAEMDRAVVDGDVPRCEAAARRASDVGLIGVLGSTCRRMHGIRLTAARLERLRGSDRPTPRR